MSAQQGLDSIDWREGDKVLFYGVGNVGRQDDGLGVRLVEILEQASLPAQWVGRISFESNYQLNVEDSLLISEYDVVVFVDASRELEGRSPFSVRELKPSAELAFSTHAMSFGAVLSLCEEFYGKRPKGYLLALPGYEWDISECLTERAQRNLELTGRSVLEKLQCTKSP